MGSDLCGVEAADCAGVDDEERYCGRTFSFFSSSSLPYSPVAHTTFCLQRSRYLNATTTLSTLLSLGVIPIINENDTISVSEILHVNKFGDNDTLSAIAAGMCGADYLFLMTDVDGLYEDNPRRVPGARRVAKVRDIEEVRRLGVFLPLPIPITPVSLTLIRSRSLHLNSRFFPRHRWDGNEAHRRRTCHRRGLRNRNHDGLSP